MSKTSKKKNNVSTSPEIKYIEAIDCPICGKLVMVDEYDRHIDNHIDAYLDYSYSDEVSMLEDVFYHLSEGCYTVENKDIPPAALPLIKLIKPELKKLELALKKMNKEEGKLRNAMCSNPEKYMPELVAYFNPPTKKSPKKNPKKNPKKGTEVQ